MEHLWHKYTLRKSKRVKTGFWTSGMIKTYKDWDINCEITQINNTILKQAVALCRSNV
jgi:hypothetical protein